MALVAYSDSEASDSEPETTVPQPPQASKKPITSTATTTTTTSNSNNNNNNNKLVDRTNPRKIRVALPDIKPEHNVDEDNGPRKKPKLGGSGGAFSGFNSFLPAPKKTTTTTASNSATEKKAPARKIFSLKTGAAPGFDREADAEMRNERAFGNLGNGNNNDEDETIPKAGSMRDQELDFGNEDNNVGGEQVVPQMKKPEEVKLKGNPMMFKPLSVGRASQQKKRKAVSDLMPAAAAVRRKEDGPTAASSTSTPTPAAAAAAAAPPPPKPKISLFSLSADDNNSTPTTTSTAPSATTYEPLVYTPLDSAPAGPSPAPEDTTTAQQPTYQTTTSDNTLSTIADDLNLSKAQRRQLFGRNAPESVAASSRVLHFNTDQEYVTNQELAHTELAAQQHNPVRAIAPGKHTLQQLVNAASTQREALEESFAAGRRNKREAGAKYGW
ncbi:hypothetical protein BO83DRAFT_378894 [Aspergillus eucalypticola CBS 122712]|uniref:Mitotic checkpoint regulator, MAD2B-interacting-domain-containing protein n=1 Tax=Aspergillus eucalypticola (strain CBS 122712 / IBT 29274) TaxID=1448314 RepID=A0A317VJ72_ASPEC|nr:uncharacterized protein BO83DRAFT_378894 [Aspergillus eucalypticola CBS 122712]PWY71910.1 hypothetical protein BO83DRAFT_378894 [Aspergillus eucalypticola CBS 122712]